MIRNLIWNVLNILLPTVLDPKDTKQVSNKASDQPTKQVTVKSNFISAGDGGILIRQQLHYCTRKSDNTVKQQ